ncbi:MAG: hypothetical protein FWH10_04895 [Oscillospiraceae bacterium]|nr:hypothetical protein [Oscillospiraceae bacterium]
MTIAQKFAALTPERQENFKAIKDAAALDAFLNENNLALTDEEKAQALEYFKSGKLPLADEELDNVAGGCGSSGDTVCPVCGSSDTKTYGDAFPGLYIECKTCKHKWPVE